VRIFPLLAASLVVSQVADASSAKDAPVLAKPEPGAARDSGGRSGAPEVIKAAADLADERDVSQRFPLPTRASPYVCPSDMVMIGRSFCIDAYEASVIQVMPDGSEKRWPYYQIIPKNVVTRAVSQPGVFPQGYISGVQAARACEGSGKRLCKADEWRNACMGPKKTTFPYGNHRETGRCNDNGRSSLRFYNPMLDDKPEHRWMWGHGGNMNDPRLNQLDGTLTRTGEREGCTNDYGVYDMVGNLHEWVDDPNGTFQGGYYLDTHLNGDGCNYRTTAHPVTHYDYSTGFRCCEDVAGM
jgi:sulfatase modifying factor 1